MFVLILVQFIKDDHYFVGCNMKWLILKRDAFPVETGRFESEFKFLDCFLK